MGCGNSTAFDKLVAHPLYRDWNDKFQALMLTKSEIKLFHKYFCKADLDGGGTINLLELLTVIDVERTPFTKRTFSIFDDDNSGEIDFGEFVLSLWNYCTLSKVALAMFAFDLYDRDSSGILEDYDLQSMMKDIFGKNFGTSHYAKQVTKDLKELESKGEVDLNRFLEFTRTHHSLLWPAFQMQLYLKKKMMGVRFWKSHAERRIKLSKNKYVKIKDLLVMNAKKQLQTYQQGPSTTIVTQTHLALEHVGTKADRKRLKSLNEGGLSDAVKPFRDQDFVKNYMNNYSLEAATASVKVRKSVDLSAGTSSVKSSDHDNGNISASASMKAAANRRKSMAQAPIDILKTVSEEIEQREKLYDLEDEEASRTKKVMLKPATDSETVVMRKKETSSSGRVLASLGVDMNVLQTFQNNMGSESGIAALPMKMSGSEVKPTRQSAATRRGSFSKGLKESESNDDPVAALLAPSSKITSSTPYRGSKAPSLTASSLAEAAAAASQKVNSMPDDSKNNSTTSIIAANKQRRERRGSL